MSNLMQDSIAVIAGRLHDGLRDVGRPPAYQDCYNFLLEAETNFTLYSSVETLFEIYRILRVFYQLDPGAGALFSQVFLVLLHPTDYFKRADWSNLLHMPEEEDGARSITSQIVPLYARWLDWDNSQDK